MIIKDCIVFLYDKEQKFIAQQLVKNLEKSYTENYIVPIDDGAFINSIGDKNKKKFKNYMVKSNAFLYKMTERSAERKVNAFVKKQKKNVNKLSAPQLEEPTHVSDELQTELIKTNDDNDKKETKLTKKQKLVYDRLTNVMNVYHRFTPKMIIVMSKKAVPMLIKARELLKVKFDVVCLIPDFALDAQYVNFDVQKYLVVNDYVKDQLVKYGISGDVIEVIGLVAVEKIAEHKSAELKAKLNIKNELPVLLLNPADVKINYLYAYFQRLVPYSKRMNIFVYTGESSNTKKFARYLAELERINKRLESVENDAAIRKESDDNLKKVDFERGNIKFFSRETKILDGVAAIADILISTPDTINVYYGLGARIPTILVAPFTVFDKKNIAYAMNLELLVEAVGLGGIDEHLEKMLIEEDYKNLQSEIQKRINKLNVATIKSYIGG